jgi:hypothetical protein
MQSISILTDSHAKGAKGAKVGNKENNGFELWSPALLAILARFA